MTYSPLYEPLAPDTLVKIREEAFRALEKVGLLMELTEAYEPLSAYGCRIDAKQRKFFIPESVIEKALVSAPKEIRLYDRIGTLSAVLAGEKVHFDPGSAAINILDYDSGEKRTPALDDLRKFSQLVSNLDNFALQSTALVPGDAPQEISDSVRLYIALKYCSKPIVTGTFRRESFRLMKEMLCAVRGGEEELRDKPLAVFDCCPSPPLRWSELTAAAVMDCAQAGIPAEFVSMPLMGATAPVTFVGALVQHTAEDLSGVVLAQAVMEGAPVIYGGSPAVFDMRSGTTPMGAIETMMLDAAYAQMGKSFGLPTHAYMGLSDSRNVDYQGGLESGMGALLAAAAGINIVSGAGMLDFESCQSMEKLVLDNEICGMALHFRKGISETGEILGFDQIAEYAESGDFLKSPHTREFYRSQQYFPSNVIERSAGGDRGDALLRAHRRAQELLAREPDALQGTVLDGIEKLMAEEAGRFGVENLRI